MRLICFRPIVPINNNNKNCFIFVQDRFNHRRWTKIKWCHKQQITTTFVLLVNLNIENTMNQIKVEKKEKSDRSDSDDDDDDYQSQSQRQCFILCLWLSLNLGSLPLPTGYTRGLSYTPSFTSFFSHTSFRKEHTYACIQSTITDAHWTPPYLFLFLFLCSLNIFFQLLKNKYPTWIEQWYLIFYWLKISVFNLINKKCCFFLWERVLLLVSLEQHYLEKSKRIFFCKKSWKTSFSYCNRHIFLTTIVEIIVI